MMLDFFSRKGKMCLNAMNRIVDMNKSSERKRLVRVFRWKHVEPTCEQYRDEPVSDVPVIMDNQSSKIG